MKTASVSIVVTLSFLLGYLLLLAGQQANPPASTDAASASSPSGSAAGTSAQVSALDLHQDPAKLPPADTAGKLAASRISGQDATSDWPAVATGPDGSLWAAYVQWNGQASDRVVVRRQSNSGAWSEPIIIDDGNWDHHIPAIAARAEGAVVVWSAQVDGNFELYSANVNAAGEIGQVHRLTRAAHGDINPRAVADSEGRVTIAWQSFRNGQSEIYARRLEGSDWGPEVKVSTSAANDWEPALALDSTGRAWISWDTYHAGNYDIVLASFDGDRATPPVPITSDGRASFHASVAVDSKDRVWIAWDEAAQNWGKDFSTSSAAVGSEGLHARRNLRVRIFANGKVFEPAADISNAFTGRMRRFAELPTIVLDHNDTPWVVYRHWTITKPHEMFHFYATRLTPEGWSTPWLLGDSSGRNTQRAAVVAGADKTLRAVYSSDGRTPENLPKDQTHALHYNVYAATLPATAPATEPELRAVDVAPLKEGFQPRRRSTMQAAGEDYTLLLGDCHRHTDVRGHSGVDASIEDTYRYAMDAAQLDFVGPSDHNEVVGGSWPDGLRDYQWWVAQKMVDVMSHPPRFWGIYTYEHSMARPGGHRNILFLKRGAPMRGIDRRKDAPAPDNLPPALWEWAEENVLTQEGQELVVVPHTFAAGPLADWNWPNAPFDCLLEIYQGARGSYERWRMPAAEKRGGTQTDDPGHFAQDALAKGNVYGFVSFSDHRSTHNSWAGVWVNRLTREAFFDAMLARRTFGASDEIILKVKAGGRMAGAKFTAKAESPPEIEIDIEAPDEILRVDVVKNGEYVYTQRPGGRSARLRYRDSNPEKGESYYYVRVFQRDAENPSGDPEIAWASPFFVTYE